MKELWFMTQIKGLLWVVLVSVGYEKNHEGAVLMVTDTVGGDNHECLSFKG
jgi:hypothetical protein